MRYDLNTLLPAKVQKFMLRKVSFLINKPYIEYSPGAFDRRKKGDYSRMDFNLIGHWSDPRAFQDPLRLQDIEIR